MSKTPFILMATLALVHADRSLARTSSEAALR